MSIDLGALYRSARHRISALVSAPGIDPNLVVPATPEWTVHDVVAHLTGVAADGTSGNMAGAPGEAWTAAQVARGEGRSIEEMLAEWEHTGALIEMYLSSPDGQSAAAAVIDVHTHEADLCNALRVQCAHPSDFLEWAGDTLRTGFQDQLAEKGLAPVELIATDADWFRGRLGRRTLDEVLAFGLPDETEYVDAFFVFGHAEKSLGEGQ